MCVELTKEQLEKLLEIGTGLIGEKYDGINCGGFVRNVYNVVGVLCIPEQFPCFAYEEIWEEKAVGYILFLHRKLTWVKKRITHMGIIFPNHHVLHYSRWINGEPKPYQVFLSTFTEVFQIYDFVEPIHKASQD